MKSSTRPPPCRNGVVLVAGPSASADFRCTMVTESIVRCCTCVTKVVCCASTRYSMCTLYSVLLVSEYKHTDLERMGQGVLSGWGRGCEAWGSCGAKPP